MKLFFKIFLPLTALSLIGVVNAQVVQKETPDALIIVSRPVDMWSPDTKFNFSSLETIKKKERYTSTLNLKAKQYQFLKVYL